MFNTIYIACPFDIFTGGTELSHQLCHALLELNYDARMLYYNEMGDFVHWDDVEKTPWGQYHTEQAIYTSLDQFAGEILVLPETALALYSKFPDCQKYIWWMSVDNYEISIGDYDQDLQNKIFEFITDKGTGHLVQSHYAYNYCIDQLGIHDDKILYLSDYINDSYFEKLIPVDLRKNYIFYNPKKGGDIIERFMRSYPDYQWVPLINMSLDKMISTLGIGKVYIDFGNHPGKDRIPREAATRGCCVLTNRSGAARNEVDIPIPEKYKWDDVEMNMKNIMSLVDDILSDYPAHFRDFGKYRQSIRHEKQVFEQQVREFVCHIVNEGNVGNERGTS